MQISLPDWLSGSAAEQTVLQVIIVADRLTIHLPLQSFTHGEFNRIEVQRILSVPLFQ